MVAHTYPLRIHCSSFTRSPAFTCGLVFEPVIVAIKNCECNQRELVTCQVRSHGDLMLMLKFNVGNRQKVVELSHANGDKFWGVWGRCLFLMMAPLFSRCRHGRLRLFACLIFVDQHPRHCTFCQPARWNLLPLGHFVDVSHCGS